MTYRVLHYLLLVVALIAGYFAYERYERGSQLGAELDAVQAQVAALAQEEQQLNLVPSKPLPPVESAMGDFIVAVRAEADLLGGSARISLPNDTVVWQPVKNGVAVSRFELDVDALKQGAPAILAMVSERIRKRTVRIAGAEVRSRSDVTGMRLKIELYGRQEP